MANQPNGWFCARPDVAGARPVGEPFRRSGHGHAQPYSTGVQETGDVSSAMQSLSLESVQTDNFPSLHSTPETPTRAVQNECTYDYAGLPRHHLQSNSGFSADLGHPGNVDPFNSVRSEIQHEQAGAIIGSGIANDATAISANMLQMHIASEPALGQPIPTGGPPMMEYFGPPHQNTHRVAVPPQIQHMHVPNQEIAIDQRYETVRNNLIRENRVRPEIIKQMVDAHGIQCLQSRSIFFDFMDDEGDRTNVTQGVSIMSKSDRKSEPSNSLVSPTNYSNAFATAQTNFGSARYPSAEYTRVTGSNQFTSTTESPLQHVYNEETSMKYPEYVHLTDRRQSYSFWPKRSPSPESLSAAGFFYTGKSDLCRCFYCGHGWCLWNESDDPFHEHIKNQQKCFFIRSWFNQESRRQPCDINMAIGGQPVGMRLPNAGQPIVGMQRDNGGQTVGMRMPNAGQPIIGMQRDNGGQPVGMRMSNAGQPIVGMQRTNGGQPVGTQMVNGGQSVGIRTPNGVQTALGMQVANGGHPVGMQMSNGRHAVECRQVTNVGNGLSGGITRQLGPRRLEPVVCKVCHTYEIGVVQLPCGHIICPACVRYDASGYLDCEICGKSVADVTAYDNSQFLKKA